MLDYFQAIVLGLLQGISELFPISSLGHSVILPRLLGWKIDQGSNDFLIFLVATHLATALVLLGFFWRDWLRIAQGLLRSFKAREIALADTDAKLGWLLVVGTIPAGIIGLVFEQQLRAFFASTQVTALFLMLNGVLLLAAERLRKQRREGSLKNLSWGQSLLVGSMQAIALLPGFSRTGASIAGGLLVGLTHEDAARFSFLLATPIIGAAAVLKLPELLDPTKTVLLGPIVLGALCSGAAAFVAVKFLTRYFRTDTLTPFGVYCIVAGLLASLAFLAGF